MKKKLVIILVSTAFALVALGCGDGEECDCCDNSFDCKPGLKCVELQGGSGKVCGEVGINYCTEGC